ncbi:MAG: hypothetical protein AB7S38_07525 [Vulcanimicrobiota bacterium]
MTFDEPDFEALAKNWLRVDPRTSAQDAQLQARIQARLAAALAERRRQVRAAAQDEGGDLVVSIDRSRLCPETGLDLSALAELAGFVEELSEGPKSDSESEDQ